jgi:hypothetical protein
MKMKSKLEEAVESFCFVCSKYCYNQGNPEDGLNREQRRWVYEILYLVSQMFRKISVTPSARNMISP